MDNNNEFVKNQQNVEIFKFFEKTRNRKVSKTSSPKSNKYIKRPLIVLPARRTGRLKSEIFVETSPKNLPDGEYDISKEDDFKTSDISLESESGVRKLKENDKSASLLSDSNVVEDEGESKNKVKQPMQRRTRLKSKLFDESSGHNLAEDELDVSKEDFKSNELTREPVKGKRKRKLGNESLLNESNADEDELKSKTSDKQLMRRTTRLKSTVFVESFPQNVSVGEMDVSQESVRGKRKLEKSNTSLNESRLNDSNAEKEELKEKQPKRRTTRLKSTVFVESIPQNVSDGEMDVSQESVKGNRKLGKSNISLNESILNDSNAEKDELKDKLPKRRITRLKSSILDESSPHNLSDVKDDISIEVKNKCKLTENLSSRSESHFNEKNLKENELESKTSLTRLRSTSFAESSEDLADKQDLNTSVLSPPKKKRKLTKEVNKRPNENLFSDSNVEENDLNVTINNIVESLEDRPEIKQKKKKKRSKTTELDNSFENSTDNMLQTIDTNAIAEMLQNTSLDSQKSEPEITETRSSKRKRTVTEQIGSDEQQELDITKNVNENAAKLDTTAKSPKKRGTKSAGENVAELNGHQREEDNILNTNDKQQFHLTNTDNDVATKLDAETKANKKRVRKSLPEQSDDTNAPQHNLKGSLTNNLNDNDEQLRDLANNDKTNTKLDTKPNKTHVRKSLTDKLDETNAEQQQQKSMEIDNSNVEVTLPDQQPPQPTLPDKTPKKRGRKPKSLNNNPQEKETNNLDTTPETPKKRGRKPKSLNNTSSNNTNTNGILKYLTVKDKPAKEVKQKTPPPQKKNTEKPTDNIESNVDDDLTANDSDQSNNHVTENTSRNRNKSINTANNTSDDHDDNKSDNDSFKLFNKELKRPVTPNSKAQKLIKVNVAKESAKKKVIKFSKLTKEQIKKSSSRKIPKHRLEEVLEMIDDEDHEQWEERNISCNPSIYTHWKSRLHAVSEQNVKLKHARQFLLRRDWISLSKILSLSNSESNTYYPLLAKYAALLLAHTDVEQFNKCMQFLARMNDGNAILKKCTRMQMDQD